MKRIIILSMVVAALFASARPPQTASASPRAEQVIFSGKTLYNGTPQADMYVLIECWGTGDNWYVKTDASGAYYLVTDTNRCPLGTELKIRSESATLVAYKYGTVQRLNTINLNLIAKIPVPEYGLMGGILAIVVGGGAIIIARRRLLHQGENI